MKSSLLTLLAALWMLLAFPAMAQMNDYTVRNVTVDVTAANGTQARIDALSQGEQEAFKRLLQQLLPEGEAAARLALADPNDISRMVRSYEVHDEEISANSYQANLDISFDPQLISAFLSGGPQAPTIRAGNVQSVSGMVSGRGNRKSTVLVLPIQRTGESPVLWGGSNYWRDIWNNVDREGTGFIRLPIGDQSDAAMMSAEQAMAAPYASFGAIAERYQAATVLVAEAVYRDAADATVLDVNLRSLGVGGQNNELTLSYEAQPDEILDDVLRRAANDITQRLLAEGQAQEAAGKAPQNRVTVLSRLGDISDWVVLRKRLKLLPSIDKVELSAISNQQADIVLYFRGSPDALVSSMASQGLQVSRAYNYWVVAF